MTGGEAQQLAEFLEDRLDEIVEREFDLLRADPGPLSPVLDMPEAVEPTLDITRRSLSEEIATIAAGMRLPPSCPPVTAELARSAAEAGLPIAIVQQGFRAGNAALVQTLEETLPVLGLSEERGEALRREAAAFMFAYANRNVEFAATEYERERARLRRAAPTATLAEVRAILAGSSDGSGLPYRLEQSHVAAIAWGPHAELALRTLGRALEREVLIVPSVGGTAWGWLGAPAGANAFQLEDGFALPTGSALAVGEAADARSGFRLSHRQARLAHRVALRSGAPVTRYGEVALEGLALGGEESIELFVESELAALDRAGDGPRLPLRETLRAYFATAQNGSAAAAVLGVSERTIAYRLRRLEGELGRAVNDRRAELDAALRLERLVAMEPEGRIRL